METEGPLIFEQLFDEESSTYTYLLGDPKSHEAVIIDAVKEHVPEYLKQLNALSLKLKYALDTHLHADHITGNGELRERTHCQAAAHDKSRAPCIDIRLHDGDTLEFGAHEILVLYTPGHTDCHVVYRLGDRLFTGDALFINGCGRTDFQNGNAGQLWDSVTQKLFTLPPETLVYPGHDYHQQHVSSIGQEKAVNPRFKDQTRESFIKLMKHLDLPDPKKMMAAIPANEMCGMS